MQPSFPRNYIHITPLCVQFSSSRVLFFLTIEVGVVDTRTVYHSRLYRKSEFVFLLTTARIFFFPPYSQPHRYSRKQNFCKTLAEGVEKQTSFGVIWGFLRLSCADVLVWQNCGMVRVIIIILHVVEEHTIGACPHALVGTVTAVERM